MAPAADAAPRHVVLVGLPGAGKSTVGPLAAHALGRAFLDFDAELERRAGRSVAEQFAEEGEAAFRAREAELSRELAGAIGGPGGPLVLAPGGGWMTNHEAREALRAAGRTVYLRVRAETAARRLAAGGAVRPLVAGAADPGAAVAALLARRGAAYEGADGVVDADAAPPEAVAARVVALVRGWEAASAGAADPHAELLAELRARFGPGAAGPAVPIYLAARGYSSERAAEVLARLGGGDDVGGRPGEGPADPGVVARGGPLAAPAGAPVADRAPGMQSPSAGPGGAGGAGEPEARPLRVWAPHERARFSPDAWGRLLALRAAGLGDQEFEHLVDRALLQLDGPVTLAELRALLGDALGAGDADPAPLH
jgi:shikimate kinase